MERLLGDDWFSICVKCRAVWRHEKGDSSYTGGMNGRCHRVTGHCAEVETWLHKHRPLLEDCPACRMPQWVKGPRANHADYNITINIAAACGADIAGVANVAASLPTSADEGGYSTSAKYGEVSMNKVIYTLGEGYPKEIVYTKFVMHNTGIGKAWREERGQVVMIPVTRK
jgi:hypothetical protein